MFGVDNMTIKELREISGTGLHECKKAIEYCKAHTDCTPLGYLMTCGIAIATPNLTFDERVKKFSIMEESGYKE